jgi:hypothetical protein
MNDYTIALAEDWITFRHEVLHLWAQGKSIPDIAKETGGDTVDVMRAIREGER